MKCLYLVPAAVLDAKILGSHDRIECPTAPGWWLVSVEVWATAEAQDRFEAYPGVLELRVVDYDKPAPSILVSGFADSRVAAVSALDTLDSALWKIRAAWPSARH